MGSPQTSTGGDNIVRNLHEEETCDGVPVLPAATGGFPVHHFRPETMPTEGRDLMASLFWGSMPPSEIPPAEPSDVTIYLCSGTDMLLERKVVHEEVAPILRDYYRTVHHIDFQIVDLCLGLPEEQLDDPWSRDVCLAELAKCRENSAGPYIAVLLGMKNGRRVLPSQISEKMFVLIRSTVKKAGSNLTLLDKWYLRDSNVSPVRYVLQTSVETNGQRLSWRDISTDLLDLVELGTNSAFSSRRMSAEDADSLTQSLLGAELTEGLHCERAADGGFAFARLLSDKTKDMASTEALRYLDVDPSTGRLDQQAFHDITHVCANLIPEIFTGTKNLQTTSISWKTLDGSKDERKLKNYLSDFGAYFFKTCRRLADRWCNSRKDLFQDELMAEVRDHWLVAGEVSEGTQIREDIAELVQDYLMSKDTDQPLILTGAPGIGKTVMAAQIGRFTQASADQLFPSLQSVVVVRFCGSFQQAPPISRLLRSLCQQLCFVMGKQQQDVPADCEAVKSCFAELLTKAEFSGMVVLVLDCLEKIHPGDQAYLFEWLPLKLASNVKLIMTVRETETQILSCLSRKFRSDSFFSIETLKPDACEDIMKEWIFGADRTMTTYQWKVLREKTRLCDNPLVLKFLLKTALSWASYDSVHLHTLPGSLAIALRMFFEDLEAKHGVMVCSKIFGYITATEGGLTLQELLSILSSDQEGLSHIFKHTASNCSTFPPFYLHRLLSEVRSFIKPRTSQGSLVYDWTDDVVRQAAKNRYLQNLSTKLTFVTITSEHFLKIWRKARGIPVTSNTGGDSAVMREIQVSNYPDSVDNISPRVAKLLPQCLAQADRLGLLKSEVLCNFQWIRSKIMNKPLVDLRLDYDCVQDRECQLVLEAIQMCRDTLALDVNLLGVELSGRLIPYLDKYMYIQQLVLQCDLAAQRYKPIVPNFHVYTTPGAPLVCELQLSTCLTGISWFQDAESLLMAIPDSDPRFFLLWNVSLGRRVRDAKVPMGDLYPSTCGQSICVVEQNRKISAYRTDNASQKWSLESTDKIGEVTVSSGFVALTPAKGTGPTLLDMDSGEVIHRLWHRCQSIALSPKDEFLLCGSDGQLFVYSLPLVERVLVLQRGEVTTKVKFFSASPNFITFSKDGILNVYKFQPSYKSASCTKILRNFNLLDFVLNTSESLILVRGAHCLQVCSVNSGKTLQNIASFPEGVFMDGTSSFTGASFSPDSAFVLASRYTYLCVWDTVTGQPLRILLSTTSPIERLFATNETEKVVCLQTNGVMQVWDLTNFDEHVKYSSKATESPVRCITYTGQTRTILCSGEGEDEVKLIDAGSGEVYGVLPHVESSAVTEVRATLDGRHAVSISAQKDMDLVFNDLENHRLPQESAHLKEIILWNVCERRKKYHALNVKAVCFSPDSSLVAFVICTGSNSFLSSYSLVTVNLSSGEEKYSQLPLFTELLCEPFAMRYKSGTGELEFCLLSVVRKEPLQNCVCVTTLHGDERPETVILKLHDLYAEVSISDQIFQAKHKGDGEVLFLYRSFDDEHLSELTEVNTGLSTGSVSAFLYDFRTNQASKHLENLFQQGPNISQSLFSSNLAFLMTKNIDIFSMSTGQKMNSLKNLDSSLSAFVLGDEYICGITNDRKMLLVARCSDGVVKAQLFLHGVGTCLCVHGDGRTVAVGCQDGRVLLFTITLGLIDPVTEIIGKLPSRKARVAVGGLLECDVQRISSAKSDLRRLSARIGRNRLSQRQRPPSYKLLSTSVQVARNYNRQRGSQSCCLQ